METNKYIGPGKPLKILVVVLVYNRINNICRWLTAWQSCYRYMDTRLAVIHNVDLPRGNDEARNRIMALHPDVYIQRRNRGLDVGAFQDLCYGRLHPITDKDWDIVHWWTDDTVPMTKNFIKPFVDKVLMEDVGAVGAEISNEVSYHMRTNCYAMRQEICKKLVFPSDMVETKLQCYQFEHAPPNPLTKQLQRMRLNVQQIDPHHHYTFGWDTEHRRNLNLWSKFWKEFPACKALGTEP